MYIKSIFLYITSVQQHLNHVAQIWSMVSVQGNIVAIIIASAQNLSEKIGKYMDEKHPSIDFLNIFDASTSATVILDTQLTVLACNKAYEALINTKREEIVNQPLFDVLSSGNPEQDEALRHSFNNVIKSGQPDRIPFMRFDVPRAVTGSLGIQSYKSSVRYWAGVNTPVLAEDGSVKYILNQPSDITQMVQLRDKNISPLLGVEFSPEQFDQQIGFFDLLYKERARIHEIFHQAPGFVCILSGKNYIFEMANQAYIEVFAQADVIGKPLIEAIPKVEEQGVIALLDEVCRTGEPFFANAMEFLVYRDNEPEPRQIFINFVYQPIRDGQDNVTGVFVQGYEVTEAYNLSQAMSYQATHDPLTGLFNRRKVEQQSKVLELQPGPHTLLYLDLDHFKIINDHCGHNAGDELLTQVAQVLEQHTKNQLLARIGGDEFLIILENTEREQAEAFAKQLSQAIADIAFYWCSNRYSITASVGIASFGSAENKRFAEGLSRADSACFLAKEKGRNRIQIHHVDDNDVVQQLRDMDWFSRLKEAMREDRIQLWAQNIVALNNPNEISYKEILSRLIDTDGTVVPPGAFITAAERYGLIEQLDRHIIRKVFSSIASMQQQNQTVPRLFINASGITLSNDNFVEFIKELTEEFPSVDTTKICLEITETAAVANLTRTAEMMRNISQLGIQFALDDFGSGVATFNYLDKLPIKFIKIDGEFITNIRSRPIGETIVKSIHAIAQITGVDTIAECIEDSELIPYLHELGIHYGQGYGIHRPAPL
jgi:diguanylate cyclase (GGDEF)-like protein